MDETVPSKGGVSTKDDECNPVGLEIDASSKRETTLIVEDMVSTDGNIGVICVEVSFIFGQETRTNSMVV